MADYHKIGLLTVRGDGRVLLCRKKRKGPGDGPPQGELRHSPPRLRLARVPEKRVTSLLILPGGKVEAGETALECLRRELREELGEVEPRELEYVGAYTDVAAGGEGRTVHIELYRGALAGEPVASAEIGELVWFGEKDDPAQLAPSLRNRVFPDLIARGLLVWKGRWSALP
jgi:hypothetical protein